MGRGDTSDAQWKLIELLLPGQQCGGKWNDHRVMLDVILWCCGPVPRGVTCPSGTAIGRASTTASTAERRTGRSIAS